MAPFVDGPQKQTSRALCPTLKKKIKDLTQSFIFGSNTFLCNGSFMCPHALWVLMGGPLKFIDGPFHLWMAPQSKTSVENFNAKTDQFYIISVTVTAQVLYSYKIKLT